MQATVNIDDSFVTAQSVKALSRFDHRARAVCFAFAPMAIGSNIKKGQINENTGNRRRGFYWLASVRTASRREARSFLRGQLLYRHERKHRGALIRPGV